MTNNLHKKIYADFLKTIEDKKLTVVMVAKKYGISRQAVYQIVNKMEKGSDKALNLCLQLGRFDCLWRIKYEPLYSVIKNSRDEGSKLVLKEMVKRMLAEGFSMRQIALLTKRDRFTLARLIKQKND